MSDFTVLTSGDRRQIADILSRRANEVASFKSNYCKDDKHFGSVELALSIEIDRLRSLARKIDPPTDAYEA